MSYQVIARKWRPQSFDEVTGQSHVTTPLRNAIRSERIPHALLLTGPRGVGKTTLARILARCLNCEKGPTDTPCGTCDACEEITSGRSTDVQEIDAASRTGVDDMREVIESIRYAPTPGKHRIFVVDEVHMLSTAAFNALLKTLEEPPPRSLFVFATTNPEKIPFTVLSRCQRYDLRRISAAEVASNLGSIAEAEGIRISPKSLLALAREGEGSMRDSQTLLDQVISFGGTEIDDETVSQVLDLIDRRVLISILGACIERDPAAVLAACGQAADKGSDPKRLGAALIGLLRDLVVVRVAPEAAEERVEASAEELAELRELAERNEPARLRRMFRILVKEQEDLAWAPEPFAVLEMALVRLATLPEGDDVSQLLARLDALERRLAGGGGGSGSSGGGASGGAAPGAGGGARGGGGRGTRSATSATPAAPSRATSEEAPAPPVQPAPPAQSEAGGARGSAHRVPDRPEPPAPSDAGPEPAHALPAAEEMASPEVVLDRIRGLAKEKSPSLHHSLLSARLAERGTDRLRFSARGEFHRKRLQDRIEDLTQICSHFLGRPTRVEISAEDAPGAGEVVQSSAVSSREEERRLRHAALNHPAIALVEKELNAEIVEIRPLGAEGERP